MPVTADRRAARLPHAALVVIGFTALFCWVFGRLLLAKVYLAESDLYDWFLPFFLSPPAKWSSDIFAGFPLVADTSDAVQYPVYFFFARVVHSWNGYVIAAYVIGASLTYAYVFTVARSRTAAAIAGVAYGLSEAMVGRQAHINFVHAFAWFPLMVLSADRVASTGAWRWVGLGAAATACCFLAGHPQPVLYAASWSVVYAAVALWRERSPSAAYVKSAVMFGLGGLLMAIKAVPFVQATRYIGRQSVGFEQFVSHANTPAQMAALLLPGIVHDSREASLYVGVSVMMCAALALARARANWRIALWAIVAVIVGLVGAGGSTPVAHFFYLLPVYNRSRVITRMMFVFAFAVAALAGFGIAALQRRELPRRAPCIAAAVTLLTLAACGVWFAAGSGMWQQCLIAAAAAAVLIAAARGVRMDVLAGALLLVIAGDLLHGLPYRVTAEGLRLITIPEGAARPSVHAQRVAAELAPLHQRWMAIAGTTRDVILPSGFARLWHIPVAGGYGPILLGNYQTLATAGNNGDVRPELLAFNDAALDLLAVRYIVVREDDFPPPPTFERGGHTWNAPALNMRIGRDDCGYPYRRTTSLRLPGRTIDGVSLVAYLRCSEDVPQGAPVASIEIVGASGAQYQRKLMAGVDIADRALSDPSVRARARHRAAAGRFDDPEAPPDLYALNLTTGAMKDPTITITGEATGGWLTIDRLTLHGSDGTDHPQSLVDLFLNDDRRWKPVRQIRTSATTDRDRDESDPIERGYTIYENLHALPRAWMVSRVTTFNDADTLAAVRFAQLPDGSRFDARAMAMVSADGADAIDRDFGHGDMDARVDEIGDGRIAITARSASGGFLVLSETYYPGWRARIDGAPTPVRRVDYSLQGVAVPRGTHTVVFEFASRAQQAGIAMSIVGVIACAALILGPPKRENGRRNGPAHVDPIR